MNVIVLLVESYRDLEILENIVKRESCYFFGLGVFGFGCFLEVFIWGVVLSFNA